ncbi:MAG: hypothetical protein A3F22_00820 [Candidatus Magasanikbacteria bacterium RIFCSPHIGHO2_12_FULL_41_16]|uniref:HMA domain-containing protein n=1 Tax=Candidatus Magasanikbacteria bacterium RIFCSPLOWO2_01_FULL_40_15 TaxID=1798686 RepID=A0A1F6N005_9BACT|nr:MAG: hypothetical protein A2794_02685 [Alphaproteobacteria bacterium RIFCSPHIGHO2_01_FULL_40_8]OGH74761.1 MAG: hypothetical protein A3F22_00820 [Candidatus Magasanikbacteria bacterium RIFCSPHIGHO2_12_FULL_41_16]OGH77249.1 MAG: hypothetical protein A2983_03935 [Candidatus Magasanikbacteria bacterium RIFCSPLOWO2_01_FULL_40_15]
MDKKLILKISGMHCVSCAMNIDGELEDMGVKNSTTSYAKNETEVVFDENKFSDKDIIGVIEKLGYTIKP